MNVCACLSKQNKVFESSVLFFNEQVTNNDWLFSECILWFQTSPIKNSQYVSCCYRLAHFQKRPLYCFRYCFVGSSVFWFGGFLWLGKGSRNGAPRKVAEIPYFQDALPFWRLWVFWSQQYSNHGGGGQREESGKKVRSFYFIIVISTLVWILPPVWI